jgi:transcription initiation factor TFIID TATA-box-binding protein
MLNARIVNIVATATLDQEINLAMLARFREVIYDSTRYGGRVAYFKSPRMKGKVSIFASGKIISAGTVQEKEASRELKEVKEFLVRERFIKPTSLTPKVQNIVIVVDLRQSMDLEKIAEECQIIYEPEQFPGGIMRFNKPFKATVLLFASGKAVITGLKDSMQIEPTIRKLKNLTRQCE